MKISLVVREVLLVVSAVIITSAVVRSFSGAVVMSDYSERIEAKRTYLIEQKKIGNVRNVEAASKDIISNLCTYWALQRSHYSNELVRVFRGVLVGLLCLLPLSVCLKGTPSKNSDKPNE